MTEFDERDRAIVAEREQALNADQGPRVGDYVEFANSVTRRISHMWPAFADTGDGWSAPASAQTSEGGSFYLGDGYVSFSGGLHPGIPVDTLTRTEEMRPGSVWVFHHDWHTAHNGVDTEIPFRVYHSTADAPR